MSRNWEKKWKLEYWIGDKLIQTLEENKPYGICKNTMIAKALHPNFKSGKFKITPVLTQV